MIIVESKTWQFDHNNHYDSIVSVDLLVMFCNPFQPILLVLNKKKKSIPIISSSLSNLCIAKEQQYDISQKLFVRLEH